MKLPSAALVGLALIVQVFVSCGLLADGLELSAMVEGVLPPQELVLHPQRFRRVYVPAFSLLRDGRIVDDTASWNDDWKRALKAAKDIGVKKIAVLRNIPDQEGHFFAQGVTEHLLRDPKASSISQLILLCGQGGYDGVMVDLRGLQAEDRPWYNQWVGRLRGVFSARGIQVFVTVLPPKFHGEENWLARGQSIKALAEASNGVLLMAAYEHGFGSGPGPIISNGMFQEITETAANELPASKGELALAMGGIRWDGIKAIGVPWDDWNSLQARLGKATRHESGELQLVTDGGEAWYVDGLALVKRVQGAEKAGFKGICLFGLGMEDPAFWRYWDQRTAKR